MQLQDQDVLARASIKAPPGMRAYSDIQPRVNVQLRPTDDGEYRWFREDGTPTIVHAPTIEQANHLAEMVWRQWEFRTNE